MALSPADSGTFTRIETKLAYVTVAASQTKQSLGAAGAVGNLLASLIVVPTTTAAGTVQIFDGSGSAITVFTGGGTLADLSTQVIPLNIVSTSGAWQVTTGANVSVIATGIFT